MSKPQVPSSPLFLNPRNVEPPPKAKKPKVRKKSSFSLGQGYGGRTSYGRTIPPLLGPDQKPFTCPCGRVQMMRTIEGGVFLFDKEGPMGAKKVGRDYDGPIATAIAYLRRAGCAVHANRPSVEDRAPEKDGPVADNLPLTK